MQISAGVDMGALRHLIIPWCHTHTHVAHVFRFLGNPSTRIPSLALAKYQQRHVKKISWFWKAARMWRSRLKDDIWRHHGDAVSPRSHPSPISLPDLAEHTHRSLSRCNPGVGVISQFALIHWYTHTHVHAQRPPHTPPPGGPGQHGLIYC